MNGYQRYIREIAEAKEGNVIMLVKKNIAYENLGRLNQWGGLAERS